MLSSSWWRTAGKITYSWKDDCKVRCCSFILVPITYLPVLVGDVYRNIVLNTPWMMIMIGDLKKSMAVFVLLIKF